MDGGICGTESASMSPRLACVFVCFQAEGGRRDLVRSRGLGDVYTSQQSWESVGGSTDSTALGGSRWTAGFLACLLYTSDAADERSRVDLGGRGSIKKKKKQTCDCEWLGFTPTHTPLIAWMSATHSDGLASNRTTMPLIT